MLGRIINTIWPLKEFLNYIFQKMLGDYILNELDLNKIEVEITKNTFISLNRIDLNTSEINKKHLQNSPIKMLEGTINKFDLIYSKEKIEIKVQEVFILLMPVMNLENFARISQLKKVPHTRTASQGRGNSEENSIISNILNSAISNLEVSVRNVCIKILTYEVFNNVQDNPTISFFINKIDFQKIPQNPSSSTANERANITDANEGEKLFLFNKRICLDKICMKIDKQITNDEDLFFSICARNDEKLLFNFFCGNSTIIGMKYSNPDEGSPNTCEIILSENQGSYNTLSSNEILNVDICLQRIEIILNPFQLHLIQNFLDICLLIFQKNSGSSSLRTQKINSSSIYEDVGPIKIFNSKLLAIDITCCLEMFNVLIIENSCAREIPKLWSFYESNYAKSLKTLDSLESHFGYLEDNFFLLHVNKIQYKNFKDRSTMMIHSATEIDNVHLTFVEYHDKVQRTKPKNTKMGQSGLRFVSNSKIGTVNQSIKTIATGEFYLNTDSIYQSVQSGEGLRNSNLIFESAMEPDFILLEKYNKLLEYDYSYTSNSIIAVSAVSDKPGSSCIRMTLLNSIPYETNLDKKGSMEISIGDVDIRIHPIYLFKITKFLYPNIIVINEIIFYINTSIDVNELTKKIEKSEGLETACADNQPKSDESSANPKIKKASSSAVSSSSSKNDKGYPKEKSHILITIEAITVSLHNFKKDSLYELTLSQYFTEFYQNNIELIANTSNKDNSNKLAVKNEMTIAQLLSKDYINIKVIGIKSLIVSNAKIRSSSWEKEDEIFLEISQMLIFYDTYLLINYSKMELPGTEIKERKEFITGIIAPIKSNTNCILLSKYSCTDISLNLNSDIDVIFNKNKMKFRKYMINIKIKEIYFDDLGRSTSVVSDSGFNFVKHVGEFISNAYKEHNILNKKDMVSYSNDHPDIFQRMSVVVNLSEEVQINLEFGIIKSVQDYFDHLLFTINMHNILKDKQQRTYRDFKDKIYGIYGIKESSSTNKAQMLNLLNFQMINLQTARACIILNRNNSIDNDDPLLKAVITKLSLTFNSLNNENELILSLSDFKLLFRKFIKPGSQLIEPSSSLNKRSQDSDDANLYYLLCYKGHTLEKSLINIFLQYKDKIQNDRNSQQLPFISNEPPIHFEDFLMKNQIVMNDMEMKLDLNINDLVFSPMFKDFDIQPLKAISDDFAKGYGMNLATSEEEYRGNEIKLVPLFENRVIDLNLEIHIGKTVVDLLYSNQKWKKDWMRMLIVMENVYFSKTCSNTILAVAKSQFHFLKDLSYSECEKNLVDKLYHMGKENSIIKNLGFAEIVNAEKIELNLFKSKKPKYGAESINMIQSDKTSECDSTSIFFNLSAIEFNLCKDSFTALKNYLTVISERVNEISPMFKSNDKPEVSFDTKENSKDLINISVEKKKGEVIKNDFQFIDNYCEVGENQNGLEVIIEKNEEEEPDDNLNIQEGGNKRGKRMTYHKRRSSSFDLISKPGEEEGEINASVLLSLLRFYLFKGKDFDFAEDDSISNATRVRREDGSQFISGMESCEMSTVNIIENYCQEKKTSSNNLSTSSKAQLGVVIPPRPRRKHRDYDNHIGLNLQNLQFNCIFYKHSEKIFSLSLKLDRLDIDDYVKLSKYKKVISKYEYEDPSPFIHLQADMLQTKNIETLFDNPLNQKVEDSELFIDVSIAPINLLIDQYTLIFLLDFFMIKLSKNESSSNSEFSSFIDKYDANNISTVQCQFGSFVKVDGPIPIEDEYVCNKNPQQQESNSANNKDEFKVIFIRKMKINEFFVNFSYNSHTISFTKLKNKNYLELLNISNITDFQINLKSFEFSGCKTLKDVGYIILKYWEEDIKKNQIVSAFMQSVSVIRPFTAIVEGFIGIFKQPWIYYKAEKSLKHGFTKGVKNFFLAFTSQSLFLGEKVLKYFFYV